MRRAKEERVLTLGRRVVTIGVVAAGVLLPVLAIVADGAKRWPIA